MTAWTALLRQARGVFTAPGFAIFTDLLTGWVLAPGRRTITAMIAVADPAGRRAHDAYHRFVRDGAWQMSALWRVLAIHAVSRFAPAGVIELVCDDTLHHKSGRHVDGAGTFRDAVRSTLARVVYALGLNLVVVALRVQPGWGGCPIAIPINVRLHRKKDTTTTIAHAAADDARDRRLATRTRTCTCAPTAPTPPWPAPACPTAMSPPGCAATPPSTSRPRHAPGDAAVPAAEAPGCPPHPNSPPAPATPTGNHVSIDQRGTTITRLVYVRDVLWYKVNKTSLVRLVVVRDPAGVEADDFFFTTDLTATGAQTATRYAGRWPIEVCFRDVKQDLGGQDPQSWKRRGPERAACLSLWLHAVIWCWYLDTHPTGRTWIPRPWYRHKRTPSFLDALAALRRLLWAQRITTMSASRPDNDEITEALLDTLAYAA